MVGCSTSEETSTADATDSVVSDPQSERKLTAEKSNLEINNNDNNERNKDLAAEEESLNISETLSELFCALEQNDVVAKLEIVQKFSPPSKLVDLLPVGREESIDESPHLGQKDRTREDDYLHDMHAKRGRFKENAKDESSDEEIIDVSIEQNADSCNYGTVAVPFENFLNKCIMVVIRHLSTQLDEDAKRWLKDSLDKILLTQEGLDGCDTISEISADIYGEGQSLNSDNFYGESMSCILDGNATIRLRECLDQHPGQIRRDVNGLVIVDALWWRRLPNLLDGLELKDVGVNLGTGGVLNKNWLKFHDDKFRAIRDSAALFLNSSSPSKTDDGAKVAAGMALGLFFLMGLGAALIASSSGDKHVKACSDRNSPENPNPPDLSPLVQLKGEPFQPFMTKVQEERARMVALFKAVDPGKLVILDELVEKRARANGFDRMWVSYKEKWGAAAVKKAFAKVREKKKEFYRAKIVALFAANQPGKLQEVVHLMVKHQDDYDRMFKRWVEIKKFDVHSVMDAHNKAMEVVGTCEA